MVSMKERNLLYAGLGIIYSMTGFIVYKKVNVVDNKKFLKINDDLQYLFNNNNSSFKNESKCFDLIALDKYKKLVISLDINNVEEDNNVNVILNDLKNLSKSINIDSIIFEKDINE